MISYAWYHPMGQLDRFGTFRRIVDWQVRSRLIGGALVRPWVNDAKLRLSRGQAGGTGNLYFGLFEFADMAFFAHFLRENDVFADVGANVGSYTVLAGKVAGARVHAFEPIETSANALHANCEANDIVDRVTIHRLALSTKSGVARFTVEKDAMNHFAAEGPGESIEVKTDTADAVLANQGVVALKIDVERSEDKVLAGASQLLAEPQLLAIQVETMMPGVREAIEGAGFVERWYDPFARKLDAAPNNMGHHNHLFLRDEAAVTQRLATAKPIRFGRQSV